MTHIDSLISEFEAIGEGEVQSRLQNDGYAGPDRAEAMRWLSLKSLDRNAALSLHATNVAEEQLAATRRLENASHLAVRAAILALVVAVASLGLSVRAINARPGLADPPALLSQVGSMLGLH